jgi:hypothetical protein
MIIMMKQQMITFIIGIFFIGIHGLSHAQQSSAQKLDISLTNEFRKMQHEAFNDNWDDFDSLIHAFKKRLKKELATGVGLDCKFDSLSKEMSIVQSEDKLMRIFSWDELSGGTWHDMAVFAQYRTSTGAIGAKQINSDREAELGEYTDVIISKIHMVKMRDKTFYLTIGWGTHGAGHHHMTAQMFSIEENKLVKCTDCFDSGADLVVVSGRGFDPGLTYDPLTKQISYNEFKEDEGGWMMPTGKLIKLKLRENSFKK